MRPPFLLAVLLLCAVCQIAGAYEIQGARPIDKLAAEQAKAKTGKKLMCIVYKGRDDSCPHCASAADNGVKAVRASTEMVVITEAQVADKALVATLPKAVQAVLAKQHTNAYVSFTVFDADLTTVIASADRYALDDDRKATREFAEKVRDARKEIK